MHEKAGEYGIVYHTRPMYEVLSTNWLTYDEVIYLKGIEEMVEVYYNSCPVPLYNAGTGGGV